jgi:hypothetical protein
MLDLFALSVLGACPQRSAERFFQNATHFDRLVETWVLEVIYPTRSHFLGEYNPIEIVLTNTEGFKTETH